MNVTSGIRRLPLIAFNWLKTNYKYLVIITLVTIIIGPIWKIWADMIYVDVKSKILRALGKPELSVGNMNGVELSIPKAYQEWPVSYSGEDDWKPTKNPPERTYRSGINHLSLIAKWPDMEHRYQGNNYESYRTRREINGSKDWISISVVSRFVNWPTAKIEQRSREEKDHHGLDYAYFLSKKLDGEWLHLPRENRYINQGIDAETGLIHASVVGPDADKPGASNKVVYWHVNEQKIVATYIECSGPLIQRLEPLKQCEHRYDLPNLHAEVVVYYYLPHLHEWREIQDKTRTFILSLEHTPTPKR